MQQQDQHVHDDVLIELIDRKSECCGFACGLCFDFHLVLPPWRNGLIASNSTYLKGQKNRKNRHATLGSLTVAQFFIRPNLKNIVGRCGQQMPHRTVTTRWP
jgi:hypothetical protein